MNKLLNILFPQFCLQCNREGDIVCNDCLSTVEIAEELFCPFCEKPNPNCNKHHNNLDGLFCVCDSSQPLVKRMLQNFTGKPYHKSLAYPLASIIIAHILLTENKDLFVENSLFFPMPISKQKKKELGYNPPLLLSKELNSFFKANSSQERVFLVDTIFSDPSLMEEKAKYFKEKGASLVYGVTVARDEV